MEKRAVVSLDEGLLRPSRKQRRVTHRSVVRDALNDLEEELAADEEEALRGPGSHHF